jgi:hypothetical protein
MGKKLIYPENKYPHNHRADKNIEKYSDLREKRHSAGNRRSKKKYPVLHDKNSYYLGKRFHAGDHQKSADKNYGKSYSHRS